MSTFSGDGHLMTDSPTARLGVADVVLEAAVEGPAPRADLIGLIRAAGDSAVAPGPPASAELGTE